MSDSTKRIVYVKLKDGVLDPQGVTIQKALAQMGFDDILSVRSGRFFELELKAGIADEEAKLNEICTKLLANPVIEEFNLEKVS
ncbi:MAG: phosphoribosylformylglycinamidine synthase subunit PurS [Candidatus Zixiibacteriota bacterium]